MKHGKKNDADNQIGKKRLAIVRLTRKNTALFVRNLLVYKSNGLYKNPGKRHPYG